MYILLLRLVDSSGARPAHERKLVFLPRKRTISAPKFNLLGLKPTEDFQPYNMGFFQPRGLSEWIQRERHADFMQSFSRRRNGMEEISSGHGDVVGIYHST